MTMTLSCALSMRGQGEQHEEAADQESHAELA